MSRRDFTIQIVPPRALLPRGVTLSGEPLYTWHVVVACEDVATGSAPTRKEARRAARVAAEQLGLITDGVDANV